MLFWLTKYTVRRHKEKDVLYITFRCNVLQIYILLTMMNILYLHFSSINTFKPIECVSTEQYLPIIAGVTM